MRSKKLHRIVLPIAGLALVCVAGCGGDDESAPATRSTAGTPEVRRDGDAYHIQSEARDGQKIAAQIGGEVKLPSDFPSDIPVFPDSKLSAAMSAGDHGSMVMFDSIESPESVHAFYAKRLPDEGWAIESDAKFGKGQVMAISKDDRKATVSVSAASGTTKISLIFGTKP